MLAAIGFADKVNFSLLYSHNHIKKKVAEEIADEFMNAL